MFASETAIGRLGKRKWIMSVQRVKIWQWVLLSIVVGIGLGYAWITQSDLEGPGSVAPRAFYSSLSGITETGEPVVRDIVIGPMLRGPNGKLVQRVQYNRVLRNRETKEWEPVPGDTVVEVPFVKTNPDPDNRLSDYLDALREKVPAMTYSRAHLQVSTLEAPIDTSAERPGIFTRMKNAYLRGLPDDRELKFWQKPSYAWLLSIFGSVLVIGVLWPLTIKALVKMGFGLPEEEGVDLRQASSSGSSPTIAAAVVTQADQDALADLNAKLEANVAGMLIDDDDEDEAEERRQEAATIKKLTGQAVEAQNAAQPEQPKDYTGEFYPVVRARGEKK